MSQKHGLDAVSRLELGEDAPHVRLHRCKRYVIASVLLKVAVCFLPRLGVRRRINPGLFAAAIGIAVTR